MTWLILICDWWPYVTAAFLGFFLLILLTLKE